MARFSFKHKTKQKPYKYGAQRRKRATTAKNEQIKKKKTVKIKIKRIAHKRNIGYIAGIYTHTIYIYIRLQISERERWR